MASVAQERLENLEGEIKLQDFIKSIIVVKWRDAHHDHISDWTGIDDIEFPNTLITSVGFLVKEDEHHLMIASTKTDSEPMVCGFFTITKRQIISVTRCEEGK